MTDVLMVLQAVISILLIIVVLLQFGKGAEAGLFSGGGDSLMTGAQQGNILVKITIILSILFMGNSILLARLEGSKADSSILDSETPLARPLNSDKDSSPEETTEKTTKEAAEKAPKKETPKEKSASPQKEEKTSQKSPKAKSSEDSKR